MKFNKLTKAQQKRISEVKLYNHKVIGKCVSSFSTILQNFLETVKILNVGNELLVHVNELAALGLRHQHGFMRNLHLVDVMTDVTKQLIAELIKTINSKTNPSERELELITAMETKFARLKLCLKAYKDILDVEEIIKKLVKDAAKLKETKDIEREKQLHLG